MLSDIELIVFGPSVASPKCLYALERTPHVVTPAVPDKEE
jgi:hypothetical protein